MASIFKVSKHKKFNYSPLYFDPEKAELNRRIEKSRSEVVSGSQSTHVPSIKGKMKKNLISQSYSSGHSEKVRRIIILASIFSLIAVFYYLLKLYGLFFVNV